MAPKTPDELRDQIKASNKEPAKAEHERTAEGVSVPTPKRGEFFKNLKKLSR